MISPHFSLYIRVHFLKNSVIITVLTTFPILNNNIKNTTKLEYVYYSYLGLIPIMSAGGDGGGDALHSTTFGI